MSDPVDYDPTTTDTYENQRKNPRFGWRGAFPSTPCPRCQNPSFTWNGDWGMGYRCTQCGRTWVETDTNA